MLRVLEPPQGLSPDEAAQWEKEAVEQRVRIWAPILADRGWELSAAEQTALQRLSEDWCDGDRVECKRRLAYMGLYLALGRKGYDDLKDPKGRPKIRKARNRQSVRIGKTGWVTDTGGNVAEVIPGDQGAVAFNGWLAQAGQGNAIKILTYWMGVSDAAFDEAGQKGSPMERWPVGPKGELREPRRYQPRKEGRQGRKGPIEDTPPDPLADTIRRQDRAELDDRIRQLPPAMRDIAKRLLARQGTCSYAEAREQVAEELETEKGIRDGGNRVDQVWSKLNHLRERDERDPEH